MEITYAGSIAIASGDTALDDIGSFDPVFETDTQDAKYLRAPQGSVIPRGNDLATIPIIVTSAPAASIAAARLAQQAFWGTLPSNGALVVEEGTTIFEYANVVKKTYTSRKLQGVTLEFTMLFRGAPPTQVADYIEDETGDSILAEQGTYLEPISDS